MPSLPPTAPSDSGDFSLRQFRLRVRHWLDLMGMGGQGGKLLLGVVALAWPPASTGCSRTSKASSSASANGATPPRRACTTTCPGRWTACCCPRSPRSISCGWAISTTARRPTPRPARKTDADRRRKHRRGRRRGVLAHQGRRPVPVPRQQTRGITAHRRRGRAARCDLPHPDPGGDVQPPPASGGRGPRAAAAAAGRRAGRHLAHPGAIAARRPARRGDRRLQRCAARPRRSGARARNEAQAYSNDIIPKARGEAERIHQEAEAYRSQVVNLAQGEAKRFDSIYQSYAQARMSPPGGCIWKAWTRC